MTCEKCWEDAYRRMLIDSTKSQSGHYRDLLKERSNNPCSPREQAGQFWDDKEQRDARAALAESAKQMEEKP